MQCSDLSLGSTQDLYWTGLDRTSPIGQDLLENGAPRNARCGQDQHRIPNGNPGEYMLMLVVGCRGLANLAQARFDPNLFNADRRRWVRILTPSRSTIDNEIKDLGINTRDL